MRVVRRLKEIRQLSRTLARPISLVPTMGALHDGHLALVGRARNTVGRQGSVVATIFVNPTQFGPHEDFGRYPRPIRQDLARLRERDCDIVFAPKAEDMYSADSSVSIQENKLSLVLCGASRPGHFSGVCTVVAKLFNLVSPDFAVFGQKDFQQLAILRRMVRDLNFPVQLISHPIVREADGLALSSRNVYLSAVQRSEAPVVQRVLRAAATKITKGFRGVARLENWMHRSIEASPLAKVDYVSVVDPDTLERKASLRPPILLAAAVFFGSTRLIDNYLLEK
jgi:pantoate--beta-alanine ligase